MPTMEVYSINELGGLITVCAGALATVLFALQKSSCTEIGCCGCHCKRDPSLIKKNINPEAVNNIEVVSPEKQDEILVSLLPDN